ncbi:MAG TPA: RDD family protein [Verrucomicrobiae bacterium]|nr:RDD family protein [Verrucomicrobiae bacterium]
MSKTSTLLIRTPEGIVFSQLLAGPVSRFMAWLIDAAILFAVSSILGIVIVLLSMVTGGAGQAIGLLAFFVLSIGYSIYFEWMWRGQTLGKRILRLRVMDAEGLRLKFSQVVIRNLLRVVDMIPMYLVGGLALVLSRRAQRLGDFAANTVVIRIPKLTEPNLDQLLAGKFNSLRAFPHLAARLRQRVSAEEGSLALQALVRRDLLEPQARLELFAELANHFRAKVAFPTEATDGTTDEQYVRNIVDLLYRSNRPAAGAAAVDSATA